MENKKEQKIWSESSVTPFPGGWIYPDHPNANVEYIEALNYQEGGTHYKKYAIQPIEYIHANKLDFFKEMWLSILRGSEIKMDLKI